MKHRIVISGGTIIYVCCRCGWPGGRVTSRAEAHLEFDTHIARIKRKQTQT